MQGAVLLLALVSAASAELRSPQSVWKQLGRYDFTGKSRPLDDPDRIKAAALMQRRGLADCEKAVELYEKALKRKPEDPTLCYECAQALNAVMRIKTNSNTLHITRMLDTPANKKVWAKYGPRALALAQKAKNGLPNDPDAFLEYCNAYFFANSVKGVLAAATTGSGLKFKGNSKQLISRFPKVDGGVGHCYLGAFYLMA
ncbi:MAG: hypothetical protein SGPRY_010622 [Prymnesium sp.]